MPREDTLTSAEEQALARARRKVSSRSSARSPSTSGRSGRTGSGRRGAARGGKGRRRRTTRSATLDTARGLALLLAAAAVAVPSGWLPATLRASGGDGFGLPDLLPATFALLAGVALDHQLAAHRRVTGRWWAGRLARRVVVLLAVGVLLAWLDQRDLATLRWTGSYARLALGGLLAWFVLRDLSRRAQVTAVAGWLALVAVAGLRGRALLPGIDSRLLGGHAVAPVDPDGLVGILATAVLAVAGAWLGAWLRARPAGPATAVAFLLTGLYVGVAGIVWAQVTAVNAARWTGPTLLLGASVGVLLLAVGHLLTSVLPTADRVRWVTATGAVALPVGVGALLTAHLLGVGQAGGPWAHATSAWVEPVLGRQLGALAVAALTAAVVARTAAALVDRGRILRA